MNKKSVKLVRSLLKDTLATYKLNNNQTTHKYFETIMALKFLIKNPTEFKEDRYQTLLSSVLDKMEDSENNLLIKQKAEVKYNKAKEIEAEINKNFYETELKSSIDSYINKIKSIHEDIK